MPPVDYILISRGYENSDVQKICFFDVAGPVQVWRSWQPKRIRPDRTGHQRTQTNRNKSRRAAVD